MAIVPFAVLAERRAATRDRLLDATIDCIADRGYAATSTTEIVRRAGVSRGAQVHHYPTKAALVAAALDQLFEERLVEFETAFAALPDERRRPDVAIDVLWTMFQGPHVRGVARAHRRGPHRSRLAAAG